MEKFWETNGPNRRLFGHVSIITFLLLGLLQWVLVVVLPEGLRY